jgi:hypothetical protein
LIINLQGTASSYVNVGNYETLNIAGISGSTVTFETSIAKYYGDGANQTNIGVTGGTQKVMLQRVPNYHNFTLNSGFWATTIAWNGIKGGVLFFRANGDVVINGSLDSYAKGYRGGARTTQGNFNGYQGESIIEYVATRTTASSYGAGGGGVGTSNAKNGGGGGAFIENGSNGVGTNPGQGGDNYNNYFGNLEDKLFFGSGGGAGSNDNDSSEGQYGGAGGRGGGILIVSAKSLSVSGGSVRSNGSKGEDAYGGSSSASETGGGGGGAGGDVLLNVDNATLGIDLVYATAGSYGLGAGAGEIGGAGGDGRVQIYNVGSVTGSTNPVATVSAAGYHSYGLYHSPVIATPDAMTYDSVSWNEYLDTYGDISVQTRSGSLDSEREYIEFDGEGDYLTGSGYSLANNSFSVGFWARRDTGGSRDFVIFQGTASTNNGLAIGFEDSNIFKFAFWGNDLNTSATYTDSDWHYWTATYDATTNARKIYRDGNVVASDTSSADYEGIGDFTIGYITPSISSTYFDGGIDEVNVWNDVRTEAEIGDDMNNGLTGTESNLIGYWNMNDTKSNTVTDITSSGNDLTIVGATRDIEREYIWESWKPFSLTTNYLMLEGMDTDTNWTGTNVTVAEGDVTRNVKMFEDEDESTVGNITKMVSSTDGGYAEATISSTDLSTYDYITAWVRASEVGNTIKLGVGESASTEQEEQITIDTADTWQKIYWDISDITSTDRDGITKLRITNLTSNTNTIYLDNIRAEKYEDTDNVMKVTSTPNDYFQYRVIFTTTNTSYQPRLENITLSYNSGYDIVLVDSNTARIYNFSGEEQYLKLDVAGGATSGGTGSGFAGGVAISDVADGEDAVAFTFNTAETFSDPSSKLLSVMNNSTEMMYLDANGNLYVAGSIISGAGLGSALTNNSGATIAKRSLVTIDPTNSNSIITTTTENQKGAFGVVQGVDVNNDIDKDGNCDNGDKCFVVFNGVTEVTTVDATLASVGDYVSSSTTAGSAKASDTQGEGLIGIVTSTANAASGYLTIVFDTQNQYMADLYVNGLIEKDLYRDMFTSLASDYSNMTLAERRGDIAEGSQAVLFDTFLDSLKMDLDLSTVGLDQYENRVGLWGDLDIGTGDTDILGNYYYGSSSSVYSKSIYYDRTQSGEQGQDSTPEVLVDLGIDPNWFNGVTLESNCTVNCSVNSNLSTTYNGGLFDISGTYGVSSEHGSLLIDVVGNTASGITANIHSTDGSCSVSGASLTYEQAYTFNAGSCSGSSITITPSSTDFNIGDTFRVASWLLEPETSNDRGDKRVFPERSIIIGSDDGTYIYVTIVDADTQKVWMTFIGDDSDESLANLLVNNSNVDISAMDMLNGQLSVGGYGYTDEVTALNVDFVDDTAFAYDPYGRYQYDSVIADRNVASGYTQKDNTTTVYDSHINDVDMEVIDDVEGSRIFSQDGWGYVNGANAVSATGIYTFPESFWGSPDVSLVTYGWYNGNNPTSLSQCSTAWTSFTTEALTVTGEDMNVKITRTDGYDLGASAAYCFTWEATGKKATAQSQKMYTAWASRDAVSLVNNTENNSGHIAWADVSTDDYQQVLIDPTRSKIWYAWDYGSDAYGRLWGLDIDTFGVDNSLATGIGSYDTVFASGPAFSPKLLSTESYTELLMNWDSQNLFLSSDQGVEVIGYEDEAWFIKTITGDYISEVKKEGTQGYWPLEMDNTSYDMEDASGEGNSFTSENLDSNDAISGVRGKGASLNGVDESMCVTTSDITGLGDMSLFSWYKGTTGADSLFGQYNTNSPIGDLWKLNIIDGGIKYFNNDNSWTNVYGSGLDDNEWHHIGIVKTTLNVTFYIDGQAVGSEDIIDINTPAGNPFCVGKFIASTGVAYYAPMDIDEPIISTELFSSDQIQKMYQSGKKALTGGHEINDTYNNIETDDARSIMVDPDGNFMYVGTEGYGMQKVDLTSDTVVSRTNPVGTNNAEIVNGRYTPVFVGDVNWEGHIMEANSNGANTTGAYYSRTFTLEENAIDAYVWMTAYSDTDDASANIDISVSNDGGTTYELATLISTQELSNGETEYEYSVDFDAPGDEIKVKIDMDRLSTKKSSIYISKWGLATLDSTDITGNGVFTGTSTTVPDGGYVEVVHNQNTYNVIATGWVKEDGKWVDIGDSSRSLVQNTSTVWDNADPDGLIRVEVFDDFIGNASLSATGGSTNIIEDGGVYYTVHTFTSDGTFEVVAGSGDVEVLIVAGGGGSGNNGGGGGGAGGVIYVDASAVVSGTYAVTVGDGGAAGSQGEDSVFNGFTAIGGGYGGSRDSSQTGGAGGSGGGAGGAASTYSGGSGTTNQGYAGGSNYAGGANAGAGGGGGCSEVGSNGGSSIGGDGGDGCAYDISGTLTYYGGGGGGGLVAGYTGTPGTGGLGGGGNGVTPGGDGEDGDPNTGGGAGGNNATGGSGIVIIRYQTAEGLYPYGIYNSPVINTPNSMSYDSISWDGELSPYGNISVQTRSGEAETREKGLDFDGNGDYLSTDETDYNFTTEDFTIEMWVKPDVNSSFYEQHLVSNEWFLVHGYCVFMLEGRIYFRTNQSGVNQLTYSVVDAVTPNVWQHIAVTRSGSNATIYVDGVDVTSVHGTHVDPITSSDNFSLSRYGDVNAYNYLGEMDEVRIWNDVRTQTEIQDNMNVELIGSETNLVGYWPLDEMSGSTTSDLSSSGNDLTIYNASWTEFYNWESWKPFSLTINYLMLESMDTHTNWTGTNIAVEEGNSVSGFETRRSVKFFEDEDEYSYSNITKLTSSTDGGYAEATISSTDLSTYDYITAWVRASEVGNTVKLGMGESAATEQEEQITIDEADKWQKIYWDISDIDSTDRDAITTLRLTNLTTNSNTIYLDNIRAEKYEDTDNVMKVTSTPNDYFQYRVIFTTTNTAYQPRLENITLSYGDSGYEIILENENTVRLYNHTGQDQELRLDVVVGQAILGVQNNEYGSVYIAPSLAQTDTSIDGNSIWINKTDNSGNLLRLQTQNNDMFVVDAGGNLTMNGDLDVEGGVLSLGTSGDQGSIRYNATTDQLEFTNDGTNWMVLGSMSKTETLSAEYAGATLSADGTDNVGSMTSDSEGSTSDSMNYYEWNSSEVSLNDYDIRVRFTLPSDFDSWGIDGGITLNYATESTSSSANQVDFYVYEESSATVDASSEDLVSSVAGTWITSTISGVDLTDCDTAGEVCVLVIRMASSGDNYVRIGDIEFTYNRSL